MKAATSALVVLAFGRFLGGQQTSGNFHGCPPTGRSGDPALNALKNRDLPPEHYGDSSLSTVLRNRPAAAIAMGKRKRETWSAEALAAVSSVEARGVRIEGRLIAVRTQGPESCNCQSSTDVDTHMWIATAADPLAKPTQSMVVEISPRELPHHPGWTKSMLVAIARQGARVRISGWITWDEEHGPEVGKSRGTLWEIHPIHRIEVLGAEGWKDLDESP